MEATAQKILKPEFILQELTEEIHRVLGRKYARAILEALDTQPDGMSFRSVDVNIVGVHGSPSSASKTLKKLVAVGWVEKKNNSYFIIDRGRQALGYAKQGDSLSSMEVKGGA